MEPNMGPDKNNTIKLHMESMFFQKEKHIFNNFWWWQMWYMIIIKNF